MDNLIKIINALQDVFNTVGIKGIDLPQIVVVGSQSAGKSSVLESIVGKDFLPRGAGMVTKRPLLLHLVNLPKTEKKEWGEFKHKPGQIYVDFEEIRKEIETETERLLKHKQSISTIPITLTIYSPNVVDLTLVDLPGLTTISVDGQEQDLTSKLREMVLKQIEQPNAIILAVTPANIDIANSAALSIAREVDPNGDRTIGVITKLDIMDKGTDCLDVLYGRVYPLKLGYIGVLNRSQEDINKKVPIKIALENEKKWFKNHPIYGKLADRMGVEYLSKTLNQLLIKHINKTLPSLKITITELLNKTRKEYSQFADEFDRKDMVLLDKIIQYCDSFQKTLTGENCNIEKHELIGGSKLFDIFENIYRPIIEKLNVLSEVSDNDIRMMIITSNGIQPGAFLTNRPIEKLITQNISNFEESTMECISNIKDEMENIFQFVACQVIVKYSELRNAIIEESKEVLTSNLDKTRDILKEIIEIQKSFIDMKHDDYKLSQIKARVYSRAVEREKEEEKKQHQQQYNQPKIEEREQPRTHQPQQGQNQRKPSPKRAKKGGNFFTNFFGGGGVEDDDEIIDEKIQPQPQKQPSPLLTPQQQQENEKLRKMEEEKKMYEEFKTRQLNPDEKTDIELVKEMAREYLIIVRKSIEDFVPKAIVHFLVNKTSKDLQNYLIERLYQKEKVDDLMSESKAVENKRLLLKKNLNALEQAYKTLENVGSNKFD